MKVLSTRQLSSLVSLTFKAVGVVMILGTLIDVVIVPLPYDLQDPEWWLRFVTQVVERGVIPLVGVALFLAGNWVDSLAGKPLQVSASWRSLQFWILVLACLLSVTYLLFTAFHINNVLRLRSQELSAIAEQAVAEEQELENRIEAEIGQSRQNIQRLLQSPELREQAISQGLISEEEVQRLNEFEQNPEQLEAFLEDLDQQAESLRTERQTEIGVRREEAAAQVRRNTFKAGLQIGLSSVLLAVGYAIIGWTGLRQYMKEA